MGEFAGLSRIERQRRAMVDVAIRACARAGVAHDHERGQHVNTSSTRIEILWNVRTSGALDDETRARLMEKLATRIDGDGTIRVVASDRRSQRQNRESAEERLAELVRKALVVQKKRRPTKPSRASKEKRISEKKKRGETKAGRRKDSFD